MNRRSYAGRNNPNTRHQIDDGYLSVIDSPAKAYLLGWIASDGSVSKVRINIEVKTSDAAILYDLAALVGGGKITSRKTKPMTAWTINSMQMVEDVCRHLKIEAGAPKSAKVCFPTISDVDNQWAFLRGYFDGDGSVRKPKEGHVTPECSVYSSSNSMLRDIHVLAGGQLNEPHIAWSGINALDFMGRLYADTSYPRLQRKYDIYIDWALWTPTLSWNNPCDNKVRFSKTRYNALPLIKHNVSDSGYDIAIVAEVKKLGDVTLYGTGLRVAPPAGYYFDLIPRSSIIKSGYTLANSIGVIDRGYVGEILVPLRKVDEKAADITLPARLVQLVLRPIIHAEYIEVEDLDTTTRGHGGFGSTN